MTQITFPGQVVNGQFQHSTDLRGLEGQAVVATLTVVPSESKTPANDEFDPEPPEWMDIEQDVYFPMTVPEVLLEKRPIIYERGTPNIILPEELPDD